jgi:hypothetical protein
MKNPASELAGFFVVGTRLLEESVEAFAKAGPGASLYFWRMSDFAALLFSARSKAVRAPCAHAVAIAAETPPIASVITKTI